MFSPSSLVPLPYVTGIKVAAVLLAVITTAEALWVALSNVALAAISLFVFLGLLSLAIAFAGFTVDKGKTEGRAYSLKMMCSVNIGLRVSAFFMLLYLGATSEWDKSATCLIEPQVADWTHHLNLLAVGLCQALQIAVLLSLALRAKLLEREIKYRSLAHYLALY